MAVWMSCSLVAWSQAAPGEGPQGPAKGPAKGGPGSLIEDRAAAKLLEAGQARIEADEPAKAVEIWQSVIERYPRSRVRFAAHLLLGKHFLNRERAYDRARVHFEAASTADNTDDEQRAEALMLSGACYYHLRNYGKCFQLMRDLIDTFPGSAFINDAYYYIGLGHFQLGHYSRAIAALENVGTAITGDKGRVEKVEAGKRLYVRLEDADLAIFDPHTPIEVEAAASSGDREKVPCFLLARHGRMALGSIATRLGKPKPGNGRLEVKGDDKVIITYLDQHTADRQMDRKVAMTVEVAGTADVRVTDGAFSESLMGVVLGKEIHIQINDADRDLSDKADTIQALVMVLRPKSQEELEAEAAKAASEAKPKSDAPAETPVTTAPAQEALKEIARRDIVLTEVRLPRRSERLEYLRLPTSRPATRPASRPAGDDKGEPRDPLAPKDAPPGGDMTADAGPADQPATRPADGEEDKKDALAAAPQTQPAMEPEEPDDGTIHTGVFRASILLSKGDKPDNGLAALPGDIIRVVYLDKRHLGEGTREALANARCLEGNIGAVRVSHAQISDQELRIQTQLKTAGALTNIGNRYKEFGLKSNAEEKYKQALTVCEEIMAEANKLGGRVLEETYVQLWRVYFEMERLDLAAAMCTRLQQQFPSSGFVDEALLQLGGVARKQGDLNRAIRTYSSVLAVRTSPLRGEAQFGIAECYDQMAKAAADAPLPPGARAPKSADAVNARVTAMKAKAFEEYKKVYDQFPDSGRVGDAVARMADYYYEQKDYARAVEIFENVFTNYPDAKFLDVILFNYGRCLFRMDRRPQALARFEQLLTEFPDSPLSADAKKIIDAMRKVGKQG